MLGLQPPEPPDREGNAAEIEGGERHQRLEREIGNRQQSRNDADQGDGDILPGMRPIDLPEKCGTRLAIRIATPST